MRGPSATSVSTQLQARVVQQLLEALPGHRAADHEHARAPAGMRLVQQSGQPREVLAGHEVVRQRGEHAAGEGLQARPPPAAGAAAGRGRVVGGRERAVAAEQDGHAARDREALRVVLADQRAVGGHPQRAARIRRAQDAEQLSREGRHAREPYGVTADRPSAEQLGRMALVELEVAVDHRAPAQLGVDGRAGAAREVRQAGGVRAAARRRPRRSPRATRRA